MKPKQQKSHHLQQVLSFLDDHVDFHQLETQYAQQNRNLTQRYQFDFDY